MNDDSRELSETNKISFDNTGKEPTFVLAISRQHYDEFGEDFLDCKTHSPSHELVKKYIGQGSSFRLDRSNRFGFARCGSVEVGEDEVILRVRLRGSKYVRHTNLTLHHLLFLVNGLQYLDGKLTHSNRSQLIEVSPGWSDGEKGHGIWGYMHPVMSRWCRDTLTIRRDEITQKVVSAMCAAWNSATGGLPIELDFLIGNDGRPAMKMLGTISNINYQDWNYLDRIPQRISSDNVDSPEQALPLLAGWFKLAEVAYGDIYGKE
mgnify:CR=1 FL=1|tara:strand:- start:3339 stop:4127 length:789 start_codon:yes stop_codon:yes gene_type:complete